MRDGIIRGVSVMTKTILYLFLLTLILLALFKILEASTSDAEWYAEQHKEEQRIQAQNAALEYMRVYGDE
jgi:hypothetical protein